MSNAFTKPVLVQLLHNGVLLLTLLCKL